MCNHRLGAIRFGRGKGLNKMQTLHKLPLAALIAGCLALLGMPFPAAAANSIAEPRSLSLAPSADKTIDNSKDTVLGDFGACFSAEKRAQIVLLIDQSGSLRKTDPGNQRLVASNYLLQHLADYTSKSNARVDIQIAGFADAYYPRDWVTVSESTLGALQASVKDVTSEANFIPVDTDYVVALNGARTALAQHRGNIPERCQAIAWFTDGLYEVDARKPAQQSRYGTSKDYAPGADLTTDAGAKQAMVAGENEMCRPGGLMDQARTEGITILGQGLNSENTVDLSLMTRVVEGKDANGNTCGKVTEPPGRMLSTEDPAELVFAFDALATPGLTPQEFKVPTCKEELCSEGVVPFTLDDSIGEVHVLAFSPEKNAQPLLVDPAGTQTQIPGDSTIKGTQGRTFEFTLNKDKYPNWSGGWQLVMTAPQVDNPNKLARVSLKLSSNIETRWVDDLTKKARAGEKLQDVKLKLVDSEKESEIDPSTLMGTLRVNAKIIDAKGTQFYVMKDADAATLAKPVTVDLTKASPGKAKMMITTDITTASATKPDGSQVSGTKLQPKITVKSFQLAPSAAFPRPTVEKVDFGTLEGKLAADTKVPLKGKGCAWLKEAQTATSPQNVNVKVTSQYSSASKCLKSTGETSMPLTLTIDTLGNGGVNGKITLVMSASDEATRTIEVPLDFTAQILKPLNATKATVAAALAGFLGVLIPLSILYLLKFLAARIPGDAYQYFKMTLSPDDAAQFQMPKESDKIGTTHSAGSSISFEEIALKAKMSLNPLGMTRVEVVSPQNKLSIGSAPAISRKGRGLVPLDLASQWVMVRESDSLVTMLLILPSGGLALDEARESAFGTARREIQQRGAELLSQQPETRGSKKSKRGKGDATVNSADVPMAAPDSPFGGAPAPTVSFSESSPANMPESPTPPATQPMNLPPQQTQAPSNPGNPFGGSNPFLNH